MVPDLQISKKVDFLMIYMICLTFYFIFWRDTFSNPRRGKQLGKAPPSNWRRQGVPTLSPLRKYKSWRRRPPWTLGGLGAKWNPWYFSKAANRNRNRVNRTMRTGTGSEPEPLMNWTGCEPEPEYIFLDRNRHELEPHLFLDPLICFEAKCLRRKVWSEIFKTKDLKRNV